MTSSEWQLPLVRGKCPFLCGPHHFLANSVTAWPLVRFEFSRARSKVQMLFSHFQETCSAIACNIPSGLPMCHLDIKSQDKRKLHDQHWGTRERSAEGAPHVFSCRANFFLHIKDLNTFYYCQNFVNTYNMPNFMLRAFTYMVLFNHCKNHMTYINIPILQMQKLSY